MKTTVFILIAAVALLGSCKPERPEPPKEKAKLFYPNESFVEDSTTIKIVEDTVDVGVEKLQKAVKTRTVAIFQEVLRLYNKHQYNAIDKQAVRYCTEKVKKKYESILKEWNALTDEEKDEYVEGPSLWWYFIGGNIDTRSGRSLKVRDDDVEVVCVDAEMAILKVVQEVQPGESTFVKVMLKNVDDKWYIDDLVPEATGGDGYNRSFMNDHW